MRVGYRAGPVNEKTEFQRQFSYGNRSTGYHGTGYYFCTKIENVVNLDRGDRPIYKLTFKDGLNWFIGTVRTHDSLKDISRFVYNYELIQYITELKRICFYASRLTFDNTNIFDSIKESYEVWNDGKSYLQWLNEDTYEEKKFVDALGTCELTRKFYDEVTKENPDWNKLAEWENESDYFDYDYIDSLNSLNNKAEIWLPSVFHMTYEFIKEFARNHQGYHEEHKSDMADSIMTVFLKELGYDGVWPSSEIDDTTYGGVIFEKESIADVELVLEKGKDYIKENYMSRNDKSLERIFSVADRNKKPIKSSYNREDVCEVCGEESDILIEDVKEELGREGYDMDTVNEFFDDKELNDYDSVCYDCERQLYKEFEKYNLNKSAAYSSKKPIKSSANMDDIYDKVKNTVDIDHFKLFGGDNEWEGVEVREALASNDLINDPDFNGKDATEEDDRLVDEMTYRLHKEVWGNEKPYERVYSSKKNLSNQNGQNFVQNQ